MALAGGADKVAAFCATVKHNADNQSASPFAAPSATSVPGDGVLDGKPGTRGTGPNNNLFGNFGNVFGFGANNGGHGHANGASVSPAPPDGGGHN